MSWGHSGGTRTISVDASGGLELRPDGFLSRDRVHSGAIIGTIGWSAANSLSDGRERMWVRLDLRIYSV